jgi:hypothetical protein
MASPCTEACKEACKDKPTALVVEDAVAKELGEADPMQKLRGSDFGDVLVMVKRRVLESLQDRSASELEDEDKAYISRRVGKMVKAILEDYELERKTPRRFKQFERVVCNVGGERKWASGTIQAINEDDPGDPTGQTMLPYVVKIDPPNSRLVCVSRDEYDLVRSEVCFGQCAGALWFTLFGLPSRVNTSKKRRFAVGERVACAVEDAGGDFSVWRAGVVLAVDCSIDKEAEELGAGGMAALVPYRVQLDAGGVVLVHRDELWLVRDLELQDDGPRQSADGTRCLTRLVKRQRGAAWEAVDHATRQRRRCMAPDSDSDDDAEAS